MSNVWSNKNRTQTIGLGPSLAAEIFNIIKLLDPHKACGHDNISSFFLILDGEELDPIFSVYFNYTFELGIIPKM